MVEKKEPGTRCGGGSQRAPGVGSGQHQSSDRLGVRPGKGEIRLRIKALLKSAVLGLDYITVIWGDFLFFLQTLDFLLCIGV